METRNKKTFIEAKKLRGVPEKALEESKKFREYKKLFKKALASSAKSIPQIAEETGLQGDVVVFYLMTARKYGIVEVEGPDDNEEYFLYKLKTNEADESED